VIRPATLAHADWSIDARKRWLARAILQPCGRYLALPPKPVGTLHDLFARLGAGVLLGVDFPIGLPRAYALSAGIEHFPTHLAQFGQGSWSAFYEVSRAPSEVCLTRPFYPHMPGKRGTVSRQHLVDGLGVDDMAALRRRCDLLADASPLFWTLGAKQVGKAAICAWRDLLAPALRDGLDLALWPFDGPLDRLLAGRRTVVAETYPAAAYRHLQLPRLSKRRQASRQACAPALFAFAQGRFDLAPCLEARIGDGFGATADGEDPFDASVGLFGMLNVVLGHRASGEPYDPAITRI
jgi:hypothetical protein